MDCFGDMEQVGQKETQSTSKPAKWARVAGERNYKNLQKFFNRGYQPYEDPRVAELSSDEIAAGHMVRGIGDNPYLEETEDAFRKYGDADAGKIGFSTIVDERGPLGSIQSYMNPYLEKVLEPMRREIALKGDQQRKSIDSSSIMSGAFGDSRHGVVEGAQRKNELQTDADVTGKAWSDAFEKAMGFRAGDAQREYQTSAFNVGEQNKAIERFRTMGIDLTNLDRGQVARQLGLASAVGGVGQNARSIDQAKLDADFQEYARREGWTPQMTALMASVLRGTPMSQSTSGTETTSSPNNMGWQALGTLAGNIFAPAGNSSPGGAGTQAIKAIPWGQIVSDRRAKENISHIGELHDGQLVYRFNYIGDPTVQIGLMAQDVEKVRPSAVSEINGIKTVNYDRATEHLI